MLEMLVKPKKLRNLTCIPNPNLLHGNLHQLEARDYTNSWLAEIGQVAS